MSSAPPKNNAATDANMMQLALLLARQNLGQAWPNPSVGAVLVKDGLLIAQGATARGGRPHAETIALEQAGENARGATLYVTLEPCSHHGKTPPCTDAIISAGIARCVIACCDPNPLVSSIDMLKAAGIEVAQGVLEKEARELNCGFFSVIEKKRPYVALKIATSADHKITFPPGDPHRWLTGDSARQYGHFLRSQYDAIATGIGTVLADDPLLTCRLRGLEDRSPVRVVFDRKGRLPPDSQLAKTADEVPVWIIENDIPTALTLLAERGITRLLVEGGAALTAAFMASGLVDRVYWFRAPMTIGDGGLSVEEALSTLADWRKTEHIALPPDTLELYDV